MKYKYALLIGILLTSVLSKAQTIEYKNIWNEAPKNIPSDVSVDAPLMGNGDLKMTVGYEPNRLRYYISKNDFWRLQSQAENLAGPRPVGFIDIGFNTLAQAKFSAVQDLQDGKTTIALNKKGVRMVCWVSATQNVIFIEMESLKDSLDVSINLSAPYNHLAELKKGNEDSINWMLRSFEKDVDISTKVAVAMKVSGQEKTDFILSPGKKILVVVAVESKFKAEDPLKAAIGQCNSINEASFQQLKGKDARWWEQYWGKSNVQISDTVLMKSYYRGLYTMAACSRDKTFAPGIFGWETTDHPNWNGDYHLNYNYSAPFYSLYSSNRLDQAYPQDAPLLDFMPRGKWYAENITKTRGILYPVGIGPLGIETMRNPQNKKWIETGNVEHGGLFWMQKSNAVYCLVNMAQCWRTTYDLGYGKLIYPYVKELVNFWEDYLKFENGRYVIYRDAIHEGSGWDKNPILSLGLVRNLFSLALDLSATLNKDAELRNKWNQILSYISVYPLQEKEGYKVFRYTEEGAAWWNDNGLGVQHIYPGNAVTMDSSAELLAISKNTIKAMGRWQDGNTSNSFYMAAIRVGYDPETVLKELRENAIHTYPNGFQLNNPHGIENACTVTNAINEMLCMGVGNVIRLFVGIPEKEDASFKNLRAWGAFLVSSSKTNRQVDGITIFSEQGRLCTLINPWPNKKVVLIRDGKISETKHGERLTFKTSINEKIEIKQL